MTIRSRNRRTLTLAIIVGVLLILLVVSAIGCGSCSCVISQPTGSSSESLDSSEELTGTDEEPASGEDDTTEATEDDETESSEPTESEEDTTESTEEESASETESEEESDEESSSTESSGEKESARGSHSSSSEPTSKPTEVSHSETPTTAPHQHTWKTEQVLVTAAYDEQVETKAAWDEIYLVFVDINGQTQRIRVPDKKGGTVTYPLEWDEEIYEVHSLCNFPGCNYDYTAYTRAHNCSFDEALDSHSETPENLALPPEQQHGGWHRENVLVNVIHHTTDTMNYYATDTFETIHHPAEYTTVHHDAVYKTVKKCTVCGAIEE